jgi:SAM-dependent methyltransferase
MKLNNFKIQTRSKKEFEKIIEQSVSNKESILAIGETSMDFKERYAQKINEFRFQKLRSINSNIIGCDINKKNVIEAQKLGFNFVYFNIEESSQIPNVFGNKKFDLILMLNVIEHLSNTGLAMESLHKLLNKNGKVIIMTDSPFYFRHFLNRIIGLKMEVAEDHTQFIVPENMIQLAQRYSFKIEAIEAVHFIQNETLSNLIKNTIGKIHPYFLDNFVYVLKKK